MSPAPSVDANVDGTLKHVAEAFVTSLRNALNKRVIFLLMGRTGVGKSSTVNSLLGQEIAPVGKHKPTTFEVTTYETKMNEITAEIIDTPGLCDKLPAEGKLASENDEIYLKRIQTKIKQFHCLLYVSEADGTRVSGDEQRALRLITQSFREQIWKRAVIVLTHAADLEPEELAVTVSERAAYLRQELANLSIPDVEAIPAVAVENNLTKFARRSDLQTCFGELYTKIFSVIDSQGALPFVIFRPGNDEQPSDANGTQSGKSASGNKSAPPLVFAETHKTEIRARINATIIPLAASVGASIGAVLGPLASVYGGAIGAALGFLAWIFTLGTAVPKPRNQTAD